MRLAFPNGEHDDFAISRGTISIGSSGDDDIALAGDLIGPGQAEITVDHRGITLMSDADDAVLKVNDRPVKSKAILRLGDRLAIGPVTMLLCGDDSRIRQPIPAVGEPDPATRNEPARYLVRGLTGACLGRAVGLYDRLTFGADAADIALPDGDSKASITIEDGKVYLRDASGVAVNGHTVGETRLEAGDQLVFLDERFLLEAPGFVPGKAYAGVDKSSGAGNTQVFSAPVLEEKKRQADDGADSAGSSSPGSKRDAIIVGVCLFLSAAMVAWLISVYLSS